MTATVNAVPEDHLVKKIDAAGGINRTIWPSPRLDLLSLAARMLEALGAGERPGNISGVCASLLHDVDRAWMRQGVSRRSLERFPPWWNRKGIPLPG
jgi:hypothetical protein